MSTALKAVFFDYGGTLDADGIAWKARFWPLYRRFGVHVPPDRFDRAFYRADDSLTAEADASLRLDEVIQLQVTRVLRNLDISDTLLAAQIAGAFFEDSLAAVRRNLGLLKRLRSRYRLGIISNNYGNLDAICRQTGLSDFIKVMVDSAQVGVSKPDTRIFYAALEALDVLPEAAVMVGDSLARDVRGARNVGMRAVWLMGRRTCRPPADPACAIISTLAELPKVLSSWA